MSECVHEVTTWRDEHGTPMLYGCIRCKVKFVPATESFDKIARLEDDNKSLIEVAEFAKGLVDKLEAECAALKADAERYRFIKQSKPNDYPKDIPTMFYFHALNDRVSSNDLDAAIDAAMQAGEKP